jgi:hypothetical protein
VINTLLRRHTLLIGRAPTPAQEFLYSTFPIGRGYKDDDRDSIRFEAVFLLALMQTFAEAGELNPDVIMFVPPEHSFWAKTQVKTVAQRIFAVPASKERHKHVGSLLHHVYIREDFPTEAPKTPWVAFGFDPESTPDWIRASLV